jgi:AcrR family transcriptional regulator
MPSVCNTSVACAMLVLRVCNRYVSQVRDALYEATVAVLAEVGWDGLTLERVAERAKRSRVTLWRNGITRESLLEALLMRLAEGYRDAMVPVLASRGSVRERLERTMYALCDVVDAHAQVLAVSDEMFHRAAEISDIPMGFLDPFLRVIADARAAGELRGGIKDVDLADVLFNGTAWPYLHFRVRHHWPAARAKRLLVTALLNGVLQPSAPGGSSKG